MTESPMIESPPSPFASVDPPPGGLARLVRAVEARRAPASRWRMRGLAAATMAAAVLVVAGVARHAPQRAFERDLHAAITQAFPPDGRVAERGIAAEWPSARADVRIVLLRPETPPPR